MHYYDLSIRVQGDGDILASSYLGDWKGRLNLDVKEIDFALQQIAEDTTKEDLLKVVGSTLFRALFDKSILANFAAMQASAADKECGLVCA